MTVTLCGVEFGFARASTAYTQDASGAAEVAVDVPVTRSMPLVSPSDGKVQRYSEDGDDLVADDGGSVDVLPLGTDGTYLYGRRYGAAGYIWRTSDLVRWQIANGSQSISYLYVAKSGTLIGVTGQVVYRSTDQGETWTASTTQPDWSSTGAYPITDWSWAEDDAGTILMGEYNAAAVGNAAYGGRRVHGTTDDGVTWSTALDVADELEGSSYLPKHCHCVAWHAATGTWLACFGDGNSPNANPLYAAVQQIWRSSDGLTWTQWGTTERYRQPVKLLDYGDAKYMLFGGDTVESRAGVIDVTAATLAEAEIRGFRLGWMDGKGLQHNAWTLALVNQNARSGVVYVPQHSSAAASASMRELAVSADLEAWTTFDAPTGLGDASNVGFVAFAGFFAGRLHFNVLNQKHYVTIRAAVMDGTGVLLSPGHTNLLSADVSVAGSLTNWYAGSGQTLALDGDAYVGTYAMRASKASSVNHVTYASFPTRVSLTGGQAYSGMVHVKAPDDSADAAQWASGALCKNSGQVGGLQTGRLNSGDWDRIVIAPYTPAATELHWIAVTPYCQVAAESAALIDALQIVAGDPQPWHVGATALAATSVSASISGDVDHTLVLQPLVASYRQSDTARKYVWSYVADAGNYLRVYYRPSAKVFGFERTVAGAAQAAVETSAVEFGDRSQITLQVTCSDSAVSLTVTMGAASQTINEAAGVADIVTWKYGDQDGAGGWPMWVATALPFSPPLAAGINQFLGLGV